MRATRGGLNRSCPPPRAVPAWKHPQKKWLNRFCPHFFLGLLSPILPPILWGYMGVIQLNFGFAFNASTTIIYAKKYYYLYSVPRTYDQYPNTNTQYQKFIEHNPKATEHNQKILAQYHKVIDLYQKAIEHLVICNFMHKVFSLLFF